MSITDNRLINNTAHKWKPSDLQVKCVFCECMYTYLTGRGWSQGCGQWSGPQTDSTSGLRLVQHLLVILIDSSSRNGPESQWTPRGEETDWERNREMQNIYYYSLLIRNWTCVSVGIPLSKTERHCERATACVCMFVFYLVGEEQSAARWRMRARPSRAQRVCVISGS